ncbi:MAG: terminase family protein [Alphaproteobacteria bacterium]|nr:terminase family protein [Alphaproteobacteria bacterium]MDD9919269.1 terminase family protein [Alphaproteobacteria bacterium]
MSLLNHKKREHGLLLAKRQLLQQREGERVEVYHPYSKQRDFHTAGKQARERLFLAGNRCGKTLAGAYEMACHLTGEYPNWWKGMRFEAPVQAWAASVTTEATRDILQKTYIGESRLLGGGTIAPHLLGRMTFKRGVADAIDTVQVRHASGGYSTLGFKSYDQGREKFQGTVRHIIHLDEEPDIDIYEECLLRTATVDGHILLTMTPLQGMTDLCERFLSAEAESGKAVIQAGWQDAPHLDESTKNRLRKSLRPHEVKAREEGIPSLGSGKVFPIEESEICVPRFELPKTYRHVFGVDFGWTNPTAAVWGGYDDVTDTLYIYRVYQRAELAPAEHAEAIRGLDGWIPGVCDPAGQSVSQADGRCLMDMYAQHGLVLTPAENSVESGLMHMLERLRDGRLKIFDDLAPWLEEFRLYRRDKKGKIVKRHDHLMDATRYLVMSGLPLAQCQPSKQKKYRPKADWRTV